jgi:hypothetical protein
MSNQLATIPATTFAHQASLRTLFFSRNVITVLPEAAFAGLTNLRLLFVASLPYESSMMLCER